jgi:hypothetical protein
LSSLDLLRNLNSRTVLEKGAIGAHGGNLVVEDVDSSSENNMMQFETPDT